MKTRVRDLLDQTDKMFSARGGLLSHWQDIAENFYLERADFTGARALGEDFGANLMTGAPALIRRELADQIAAMIRPRGKNWFGIAPQDERLSESTAVVEWGKRAVGIQFRAMYDPAARLTRATKETDNDYVSFGQGVMTVEADEDRTTLVYRNWHLRDTAWAENDRMEVDRIARNWKIQARDMCNNPRWADKVSAKVKNIVAKEPMKEIKCRHIVLPYDEYDYSPEGKRKAGKFKFMSILVDCENDVILEETPQADHSYIIPRWQTVSGSPYAHSPATVIALADARLLQRITFTLLQAGEKAVDPPMIATQEMVRSDIALYAGGVTWVDAEYDERMGDVLRPITMDKSGLGYGMDVADKHEEVIRQAFYLNKIMLPAYDGKAMTATEVRTRTEEYIRSALPLFEPIEAEYSGQLCEKTFNLLLRYGAFGDPREWPQELSGAELKFTFQSPLVDAMNREDALSFRETADLLAIAAQIDPTLKNDYDVRTHFRRAMKGLGAPMIDEEQADEASAAQNQMAEMSAMVNMAGQGGAAAEQVGKAAQSIVGVEQMAGA